MIHQDSPHGFRCRGEEMPAIGKSFLPTAVGGVSLTTLYKPQIGFVHERRGIQRVARCFAGHVASRQLAQLVVNQRQKLCSGVRVAGVEGAKNSREIRHEGSISDLRLAIIPSTGLIVTRET
jgi:hypothetical protein